MAKSVYLNSLRRYTKLQALYLSGPGSVRPVGIKQVFGIAASAPCLCHPEALEGDRWVPLTHIDLARRLGVAGLVEPALTEVPEVGFTIDSSSIMDIWRFPQTEYCTGCQTLQSWSEASGSGSRSRGPDALGWCVEGSSAGHPRRRQTTQFEFVWVCEQGHLEGYAPWCPACQSRLKRAGSATDFAVPLKCSSCEYAAEITLEDTKECSGLLPHASNPGQRVAPCAERMCLRRLTDASIWQGAMLTALHLPRHARVTEEQYDLITEAISTRAFATKRDHDTRLSYVRDKLVEAGLESGVDDGAIETVMSRLEDPGQTVEPEHLDRDLRLAEMEELLILRDRDIDMPLLVGSRTKDLVGGPFTGTSGLDRLRATTVLTGASRLGAESARTLIWGHQPGVINDTGHGWLPAFESFGEGLLLWIDQDWLDTLDDAYEAVHTCSHVALRGLAKHAGISETAVRERVYLNPIPAVLLYVATGDQVGTLGGLSSLSRDPTWLGDVLQEEVRAQRWCAMDPICESDRGGACHHCLFLSETSCEGVLSGRGVQHNARLRRSSLAHWWA